MAGLMLMAMIVVMVVVLFVQLVRQKPMKKLLLSYLLILGSFHLFVSYSCGPNSADVKVMKPMAQKIADYIVAHGIPKSLADIPDLPYEVEGCERRVTYKNSTIIPIKIVKTEEDANFAIIEEGCTFQEDSKKYSLSIFFTKDYDDTIGEGNLKLINWQSATAISYIFKGAKEHKFVLQYIPKFYSGNTSGICAPFRP